MVFPLHLAGQMHLLLDCQQHGATLCQLLNGCMKTLTLRFGHPAEPQRIRFGYQLKQGLAQSGIQFLPQDLEIQRGLPINGNRTKPAQLLKACQLFNRIMGGQKVLVPHRNQPACMEATSAAKSFSSTSIPSPRV